MRRHPILSLAASLALCLSAPAQDVPVDIPYVKFALPNGLTVKVRALTQRDITAAAETLIRPGHLVWGIVVDRARIEAGIRELNYGEVRIVDADGNSAQ